MLARAWAAGAGPGDAPFTIDLDSTICETYGLDKEGARHHGYTGKRGYHPLLAVAAGTSDVLMSRLREGRANTARGAAHFLRETVGRVRYAGASGQLTLRADSGFYTHRVSRRAYDGRRQAADKQHKEDLRGGPAAPDSLSNAISQTANRTNQPWPIPTNGTTKSRDRQEYDRLRNQRPERKEYYRRRAQEQRQRAKESGLCRHCSKQTIPGKTRRVQCADKHRESRRRTEARRRTTAK